MQRRPISYDEKIDARFVRGAQSQCWWWLGSYREGRPILNLRHVTRYIYEREIAPIPPGMTLSRTDHTQDCTSYELCVHYKCVNPWHQRLNPARYGLYEREVSHDSTSSEHVAEYKRRVRRGAQNRRSNE